MTDEDRSTRMDPPASDDTADASSDEQILESRPQGFLGTPGRMSSLMGASGMPVRGFKRTFAAFRYIDYRRLWIASCGSSIGTWVQQIAIGWLVYELSGSAVWLGIQGFAGQVPMVILLPWMGVLADMMDRRAIMLLGNTLMMAVALSLMIIHLAGALAVWHLITAAAINGVASAMLIPTNQSLMVSLIHPNDMRNAVALNSMQFNLSRLIGPALGGVVMKVFGAAASFAINTLTFVPLLVVALRMNVPERSPSPSGRQLGVIASFVEGLRYLRTRPDLMVIEMTIFASAFASALILQMLPAFSRTIYGGGETLYSLMLSAFGCGALIGAAFMATFSGRDSSPWRSLPILVVFALTLIGLSFVPPLPAAMVLIVLCGIAFVGCNNRLVAAVMGSTPDYFRGRMSSIHVLCFSMGLPLGSVLAGVLAPRIGIDQVFGLYGVILLVAVAIIAAFVHVKDIRYAGRILAAETIA